MPVNRNSRGQVALLPYQTFAAGNYGGESIHEHRHHNIAAGAAIAAEEPLLLGSTYTTSDGRVFRYVQQLVAAALLGSVLERAANTAVDTVSSGDDLLTITQPSAGWTVGEFAGDYAYIDEGAVATEEGQCRRILGNTADTLHIDRPLLIALDITDSDLTIIRPFRTILATVGITTPVSGVASVLNPAAGAGPGTSAIDINSYGWIQVRGFCEHILIHDTASVAGGDLVVDDGTAGYATDVGTGAAWPDQYVFGTAHMANVSNTIPGDLTNCLLG